MIYACVLHTSHAEGPEDKVRSTILIEAIDHFRRVIMTHWGQGGMCLAFDYLLVPLCPILMVNGQIQKPQSEKSLMTRDLETIRYDFESPHQLSHQDQLKPCCWRRESKKGCGEKR